MDLALAAVVGRCWEESIVKRAILLADLAAVSATDPPANMSAVGDFASWLLTQVRHTGYKIDRVQNAAWYMPAWYMP